MFKSQIVLTRAGRQTHNAESPPPPVSRHQQQSSLGTIGNVTGDHLAACEALTSSWGGSMEKQTQETREREREREGVCVLSLREKKLETGDGVPERRTNTMSSELRQPTNNERRIK